MLGGRSEGPGSIHHLPSTLIHHPAQPSSSSSPYPPSPGYPSLGMGGNGNGATRQRQQFSPVSGNNRGPSALASVYSAKVVAFHQSGDRQSQLSQSPGTALGLPSANSSQTSRSSSVEEPPAPMTAAAGDDDDSFFSFDSLSSNEPYQHLPFPPTGPLHPSELQLAGKHHLVQKPLRPSHGVHPSP